MTLRLPLIGAAAALFALVADQWSKAAVQAYFAGTGNDFAEVTPFLNFVLTRNNGISFSLLSSIGRFGPTLLICFAFVIIAVLLYQLWQSRTVGTALGWGLIIGGAVGNNLLDRLRLGSVVDFIDAHIGQFHPFVFNVADAAISVGVVFLLLDGLLTRPESPK